MDTLLNTTHAKTLKVLVCVSRMGSGDKNEPLI